MQPLCTPNGSPWGGAAPKPPDHVLSRRGGGPVLCSVTCGQWWGCRPEPPDSPHARPRARWTAK
eukprot:3494994-Prymnesium_polylepis.1